MPMDYRVSLDCGHTYDYRTVVPPMQREQLTCLRCGPGQHALSAALLSGGECVFDRFGREVCAGDEVAGGPAAA